MQKAILLALTLSTAFAAHGFDAATKYSQTCAMCHASGVAGAPKAFNQADWAPRLKLGLPALVNSVTNGKNAMPPRGLCNDCTAEQYTDLIQYMAKAK